MAKDLTAIRIEAKAIEALKRIAKQKDGVFSDRSVSWLIRRAVDEFIVRNSKQEKQD
jgi:predicted transcriptional regulator